MVNPWYLNQKGFAIIQAERERIHALLEKRRLHREREAEAIRLAIQMGGWTESQIGELVETFKGLA